LIARPGASGNVLQAIRRDYAAEWRTNFTRRIHVATILAHGAMRAATATIAVAMLQRVPGLLTLGAQWSGKAQPLRSSHSGPVRALVP